MGILALRADERVEAVNFTQDSLRGVVERRPSHQRSPDLVSTLVGGYSSSAAKLADFRRCYGIHWPQLDEDLSTEGLLRGAPAPQRSVKASIGSDSCH